MVRRRRRDEHGEPAVERGVSSKSTAPASLTGEQKHAETDENHWPHRAPLDPVEDASVRGQQDHARMYTGTARPPLTIVAATHIRRTSEGSRSKYSAIPPATPAHMRSRVLRISRRGCGGGGAYGGYADGGVG